MISRLIKILSLLHSRQSISRENLASSCGVSEETVSRYVANLTEAGVPVSYDPVTGIYNLTDGSNAFEDDRMSPFDVFLLRLAVRLLKKRLNGLYQPTVDHIESHLQNLSSQKVPLRVDHLLDSMERRSDSPHLIRDLNCCLILEAIRLGREIQVVQSDQSGLTRETVVEKASLEFGDEWVLRDLGGAGDRTIPISTVTDIRLV
jgi:predicted DNA-binding transcriptional regulator YafY